MAPRSPMWFARRSSSSAIARIVWVRGVLWLLASASSAPQHASAWPITVAPALHSAVLVSQHDLQGQHFLPICLEAEVPRLDDTRVHRSHGDFVHVLARDSREGIRFPIDAPRGKAARRVVGGMPSQRPQTGSPERGDPALLGDLALEQL